MQHCSRAPIESTARGLHHGMNVLPPPAVRSSHRGSLPQAANIATMKTHQAACHGTRSIDASSPSRQRC
jgi:hypothetical protein